MCLFAEVLRRIPGGAARAVSAALAVGYRLGCSSPAVLGAAHPPERNPGAPCPNETTAAAARAGGAGGRSRQRRRQLIPGWLGRELGTAAQPQLCGRSAGSVPPLP